MCRAKYSMIKIGSIFTGALVRHFITGNYGLEMFCKPSEIQTETQKLCVFSYIKILTPLPPSTYTNVSVLQTGNFERYEKEL